MVRKDEKRGIGVWAAHASPVEMQRGRRRVEEEGGREAER
jgi:hypothetical protein